MRVRVWAVVVALLVGGIVALVLVGGQAGSARSDGLVRPDGPARVAKPSSLTEWSGGSDPGLHVMPFPGTPDASPSTQVVFSALLPSAVRSVSVVGSQSGRHAGHIVELPDDSGTAFVPDRQFVNSETVTVDAVLSSAAAGAASGAPGARRLSFSFRVAAPDNGTTSGPAQTSGAPAQAAPASKPAPQPAPAQPARSYPPAQHFHTLSGLNPPIVRVDGDPDHTSGDIFLTPNNGRQHGPMIVNPRGQLLWFDHITNRLSVYNLEAKTYHGKPVLTWWQGEFADAHGIDGTGVIMSDSYRILKTVRAGDGYTSDLHEFQVTPQGTAWIDCYVPVHANLTSQGGSANGVVLDGVIQKIDIRTGRVLWEWHSLGHIPITDSEYGASNGGQYDYFHLNSIQPLPNGKLIVSARNTWGVYEIDERTGRVDWTLGGKHSSFRIGAGAGFEWQHHATLHRNGLLTVFDDAKIPQPESSSSAKELRLNFAKRKASLVVRDGHSPPVIALYEGSAQLLPNHNLFVGWGDIKYFSEYTPGGRQIFNGSFLGDVNSYRAYRFRWHGQPHAAPAIAVSRAPNGAVRVYSAWNGATDVARWRVLGGAVRGHLSRLGEASDRGFESGQWIHAEPGYLAVQALDAHGKVLGHSTTIARPDGLAVFGQDAFVSSGHGSGTLPVTCFTSHSATCAVKATITAGRTVLATTRSQSLPANGAALLNFRLSSTGRMMLASAPSHRLTTQVTVRDSSGDSARRQIKLIPFTTHGSGPRRTVVAAPTFEILDPTAFVASHHGQGSLVATCYAAVRCRVAGTLSAGGQTIAMVRQTSLGANEAGSVSFQLTAAGQSMLGSARGNQLAVQATLSNGSDLATGQIALVRYR